MMRTLTSLFVVLGLAVAAQGALIAYEGVTYAPIGNGDLNGLTGVDSTPLSGVTGQRATEVGLGGNNNPNILDGWDNYAGVANLGALAGSLSYPQPGDAGLPTLGNKLVGGTIGSMDRTLASPIGDINGPSTVYYSVLMNPGATVNHFQTLDFQDVNMGTGTGRMELGGWGGGGAGYRLYAGNPLGWVGPAAVAQTTYLFVGKIEFTGDANPDAFTFWVDPTLSLGEGGNVATASGTYAGGSYDSIVTYFYQDFGMWDEIKVATSWADLLTVAEVPEPATMSVLVLGGLGVLLRRKRR